MKAFPKLCAAALALAASSGAQAQTVFASGSYDAGEQVNGGGGLFLGPGTYRFSFITTAPFADFYGQVEKQYYRSEYCDFREGAGEEFCAGTNYPITPLFDPVTPTLYQLQITVDPFRETFTPEDIVVRTVEFDECCTYAFDFTAGGEGSFSISYAAIPEPDSWALLILGFGLIGAAHRRRTALRLATS